MHLKLLDNIFLNYNDLFEFITDYKILPISKPCSRCDGTMTLKIFIAKKIKYRCDRKNCQFRQSIKNTKIDILKYVHCVYLLMADVNYSQLNLFYGLSNATIMKLKYDLREAYKVYIEKHPIYLGGLRTVCEIDETVLSRRQIIRDPTSTDDDYLDTIWIVGAIDNSPEKNFLIERVENRQADTLSFLFDGKIRVGTKVCTDGCPSYPKMCENLALKHKVVNHSVGFFAPDGTHTNNIEGFWSHLKSKMRKENGVKRDNLDSWLVEYTFKRRYITNFSGEEFQNMFVEVLKILLK
ncbi:hypothetical protein DMUE_5676 [Dictyocoela muelleri]|nr:hypothetical protein DMUE_5676 [Dictyocoela muelleri]